MELHTQRSAMEYSKTEDRLFSKLLSPFKIQEFLDALPYSDEVRYRCPRSVVMDRKAHCFDGAVFAAAALSMIGYPPLLVDMLPNDRDDDHILAVFRRKNHWGAVAKSNFTSLRYREPVYLTLRELVMSYFDFYFNTDGDKSLRSYSLPLDLTIYNKRQWSTTDEDLEYIGDKLEKIRHFPVVNDKMIKNLKKASDIMLQAGMLGSKPEGLFKPTNPLTAKSAKL